MEPRKLHSQQKAWILVLALLAFAAALGVCEIDDRLAAKGATASRILFHAWLGTTAALIVLTYLG